MINIFRSKKYKQVANLLENNGFYSKIFKQFKVGQIVREILLQELLPQFRQIVNENKLTHFKLLKISLLVLHMLQISETIHQNAHIQEIIRQLQMKTKTVMHYSRRPSGRSLDYSSKEHQNKELQGNFTSKEFSNQHEEEFPENIEQNSVSFLLGKLVQPLLHIEEKIIYSHELIYRPSTIMDSDTCWATLNLLKKYAELSRVIEEIGRYYKDYKDAIVCTIRVLSLDIRILYGRVADYLKKQCTEIQVRIQLNNVLMFQPEQEQKIKQMLLLVQELQSINQNVRIFYHNKYFCSTLASNHIYMPSIFQTGEDNLQILFSFLEFKNKVYPRIAKITTPPKHAKADSLERVQSI